MNKLFCELKTDEEKAEFFLSGRGYETGVIAHSIQNDVAMAYHRCAQFKKENDELRAKIEAMEQQKPVAWLQHAARMAALARKLREPDWHFESIREMQRELCALEEAALAAAPEAEP